MKKVLIATTALVMVAGAASADVTISGYGRFGLQYNGSNTGNTKKMQITERMRLNIDASKTTDTGLTFGGRIRIQYDAGSASRGTAASLNAAKLYVKSGGLTVEVGNVEEALDSMSTYYNGEVGLTGNGDADTLNQGGFYAYNSSPGGANRMGVGVSYTMGDSGRLARPTSPLISPKNSGVRGETAASIDYKFGALKVGAGYVASSGGAAGHNLAVLTAEYALGSINIGGVVANSSSYKAREYGRSTRPTKCTATPSSVTSVLAPS